MSFKVFDMMQERSAAIHYKVDYTNAAFRAASASVSVPLMTLGQYQKLRQVTAKHSTAFSDGAGAMTDVSVAITDVGSSAKYLDVSSVGEATAPADTTFYDSTPGTSQTMAAAGGAIAAVFASSGRNFGVAGASITAATQANPCQLTIVAHGMLTNCYAAVTGATGAWAVINGVWKITKVAADTFTIPVNTSAIVPALAGVPVASYTFLNAGALDVWMDILDLTL